MVKMIPVGFWGRRHLKSALDNAGRMQRFTSCFHTTCPNTCSKYSGVFCVAKNAALPHFSYPFPFLMQWELLLSCPQVWETLFHLKGFLIKDQNEMRESEIKGNIKTKPTKKEYFSIICWNSFLSLQRENCHWKLGTNLIWLFLKYANTWENSWAQAINTAKTISLSSCTSQSSGHWKYLPRTTWNSGKSNHSTPKLRAQYPKMRAQLWKPELFGESSETDLTATCSPLPFTSPGLGCLVVSAGKKKIKNSLLNSVHHPQVLQDQRNAKV